MAASEESDAFLKRVEGVVHDAFLSLGLTLGYKLKLFDTLAALTDNEHHKTSQEIADAAGYRERSAIFKWVREWLCAMVCGNVVEAEPCGKLFWLPPSRAPALLSTSEKSPLPLGLILVMQTFVTDKIVECFKPDGPTGLGYEHYTDFHKLMSLFTSMGYEKHVVKDFVPQVDGLVEKLQSGIRCLDIGCGAGVPSRVLAEAFPNSDFWAVDFGAAAIAEAKKSTGGLKNVHYVEMDCTSMDAAWTEHFDYITAFDAIHDQVRPDLVLKEIWRILKPGGVFSMYDIKGHSNCYLDKQPGTCFGLLGYISSLFHCMSVSLAGEGGVGLGTMWGAAVAREMLKTAGFVRIEEKVPFDPMNTHYISHKP